MVYNTTHKNCDDWGIVYYCFNHINIYRGCYAYLSGESGYHLWSVGWSSKSWHGYGSKPNPWNPRVHWTKKTLGFLDVHICGNWEVFIPSMKTWSTRVNFMGLCFMGICLMGIFYGNIIYIYVSTYLILYIYTSNNMKQVCAKKLHCVFLFFEN